MAHVNLGLPFKFNLTLWISTQVVSVKNLSTIKVLIFAGCMEEVSKVCIFALGLIIEK